MHPTRFFPLALAACAALSLGACERAPDDAPGAPAADAGAPSADPQAGGDADGIDAGGIDATQVVDRSPIAGAGSGFDVKRFAGLFTAPGTELRLAADGTYTLVTPAGSGGADAAASGTWTVEAGGTELRLDPDSKDEADRRYAIATNDALVAFEGGQALRRRGD